MHLKLNFWVSIWTVYTVMTEMEDKKIYSSERFNQLFP